MILLFVIFTSFFCKCYSTELTTEQIQEIKDTKVRSPLHEHVFSLKEVPPSLSLEQTILGICSLYKTNTGDRTFTLHLHTLTDKLRFDSTEAWRNLDYSFDGITGERKPSWAEQAQSIFLKHKNLLNSLQLKDLILLYTREYNKINRYKKIFIKGATEKQKYHDSNFIIPQSYVQQLINIEKNPQKAPNPMIFAYLYNRINELRQQRKSSFYSTLASIKEDEEGIS